MREVAEIMKARKVKGVLELIRSGYVWSSERSW